MTNKKKILALLMLCVAAAPLFFFTVYLVKQKMIHHQMVERLESSALITITIKQADLKWEKAGQEAIVDGELFDVKSYRVEKDNVVLIGLYDYAEKKLKNDFAKIVHQKKDDSVPLEKLLLKFISTAALISNTVYENNFLNSVKLEYHIYKQVCISNCLVVLTPPPNVLV